MFDYPENYGPFVSFTRGEKTIIYTKDITSDNVDYYFNSLLNVLRDGINSDQVMSNFITYVFDDGTDVDLSIPDSYTNIALWKLVVMTGNHIEPKHLVFEDDFVADMIADFINNYLIIPYRKDMDNIRLNNIIDDIEYQFKSIDEFSMFLANTANLKDYRDLMNENPRAYDIMH